MGRRARLLLFWRSDGPCAPAPEEDPAEKDPAEEDPTSPQASDTRLRPATDPRRDAPADPCEGSRRRAAGRRAAKARRRLRAERRAAPRGLRRLDQRPAREDGVTGAELGPGAGPAEPRGDRRALPEDPAGGRARTGHPGVAPPGRLRGVRPRAPVGGRRSSPRRARAQRLRRAERLNVSSSSTAAPASIVRPLSWTDARCASANALSSRACRADSALGRTTIEAQSRRLSIAPQSATPASARQRGLPPDTARTAEAVSAIAHR